MVAILTIEGVLSQGDDLRNSAPTKWAKQLYDGLRQPFSMILFSRTDHEITRWWMKQNGMFALWSQLLCWPDDLFTYPEWRVDQIRGFLADGWEINFFIDTDPDVVAAALKMGVPTMKVSYPGNAVGWREPSQTAPRAWAEVVDTVETHSLAKGGADGSR